MKRSNFLILIIILLLILFISSIIYILFFLEDYTIEMKEQLNTKEYEMTLEERIKYSSSIPKKNWIRVKSKHNTLYFKGKANAGKIDKQLTEPFELDSDYVLELGNGSERVLLLETFLDGGGVTPIKYVNDSDIIESGIYRLNIVSEYDFKIVLRRK